MNLLAFLKMFGAGFVQRELAHLIGRHITAAGYEALAEKFAAGATACSDQKPDEVAQVVTDILFSVH